MAIMKPQNFLLENLKFATAEEFSKKISEILPVEDFSLEKIGNCGCGPAERVVDSCDSISHIGHHPQYLY